MSWAEYKKKRKEQENMEMSYSQENNDSNNETSSWQKYKQKREEQKVQQTETLPVANKANTAQKTTTNLTEADLRKIEQNSGLKTGTLNLNKMQAQQQKFENLQQKGNEILQDKNNKIYDVDYIYSDLGIDNGKVFKKSSAFKDGYDFGDITKTVLDTGATLGTEVTKGVANIGENIGDLASYGIAGVADLLGEDEYADKVRKNAQVSLVDKYTKPLSSKIDKNSILGSKGKEMAQSLGYVAGTAAIGAATGGTAGILGKTAEGAAKAANIATTATTFASSMGSGVTEAYQNGATDQEALAYGIISGIGEAGSELMFGGLGKVFGKVGFNPTGGALDEVVVQGLSRNIKNKMAKTLVQSGLMATGEGIEEVVSGVVSAIGKKATFMKEEDLKNILKDENLAEQFWMGALTSVIAQAPSTISSIKNKTDYLTGEKWETTQKNETPELPQNVQNNIEQQTIQTDTKTAQNQNISQINNANNNNLKNTAINEINNSKISEQAKKDMLNAINGMENVDEESYNNIKQTLNEINKNELQTNSKYQDNLERRKNYVKYKDDINTYDNSAVEEVLSIIPTNRNGKRTVNQWLQVADEIGKRISGKSNAEIQEIAYKSWFENQPTKNITQYDSARKTSIGFQKLNSDMWVNKINEAVLKERTRLENTTNSQQVNFNNTQTNQESLFEDILNNKELPMQSYIYEKSDNPNVDILRKSASKYLNNSEQAHKFVQILEKISQDKNVEIRFNADLKTPEGKIANVSYSNGVITINPNSTRAGEFIAIHELTHAIGTDSMKNIIETYRKSNPEFNTSVEKLLQNYNSTEITEEALSDVSAQLFGNQEFINNIAQTNPNIFQKIYSEIKYLWHQFRGYKNQNQFIEDLYYKWTQAYNSNNKLNNSENYLITQNNKGKYVKADRQVITGNNPLEWETQVENYINDNIRQGKDVQVTTENGDILTITKDTSGKAKFRNQITDKYGNTRYLNNKEFLSKLTAETHIDELAQISQKINKNPIPDYKKHKFAKDGFDYRSAYFEDFDGQYYKITMSVGKNGNIDTIYNIGKMDKKNRSKSSLVAQRPSDKNITSNEELTSTNSIPSSNKDVNTTTKYSIQESENNSGSFSMQDNQGRTLTKEQQEYFKDSKIKDRNGLLMTVYHGTNNDFNIFDKQYVSKNTKNAGFYGDGFYFTPDKESARQYGKSLKEVYLDIKNPFSFSELSKYNGEDYYSDYVKIKNLVELNSEWGNIPVKFNDKNTWGDIYEDVKAMLDGNKTDEEIDNLMYDKYGEISEKINDRLYNYSKRNNYKTLSQVLEENGYDGIINRETPENSTEIVAFNSNQIKNVDNTNPTDNPDIRYSQNNGTWQSYLDKNFKPTGTRTNMQDILVSKATNNNKERVRDILSRNGTFSEQVDKYIADKLPSGDFLYLGETPTVLQNLGLPNNEVILKQNKLKTLMQESNNNTDKLHGLPIETIKKIPEAIANPLNILQSSTDENSVVIITDLADANERPIIASIEVNYDGQIGNIDFLSNRLTSAYGKNNYDRFMKTEIAKGNLLYDIDEGIIKELPATRLQSPKGISSFVDTNNNVSTINSSISQNNDSVKSNTIITNNYAQQIQNDTHKNQNVAPSVANNSLPIGEYTGKQRKHYKSIMESAETTPQAKKIAKELLNSDTYVPETNKGQLEQADARIMSSTPESELNSLSAKAINGEKISSVDIAVGERLIQYYSKTGNAVKLQEAIQTTAMAGTSAGQTVQALSLLNHQTPQGQAMWLQKSVDKMNNELARRKGGKISKDENGNIRVINNKGVDITEKVELFNLTPEMIQNVVSSKNDTELNKNLNKVYEQLGQQVTRTTAQKIDAWRYFSMLANPRTHIRNITGNVAMGGVQGIKNKVAGVIEGVANKINPDMERSHTIKPASKEVKAFAKADIENVTDRLGLSENKYNPKTRLENSMRTFKSDVMENTVGKMFDLNNKALEVEDGWGLKAGYAKALSEYMTANNLTPDTMTDKQLGKARNYAIQQAKEATFHQDSSIASLLNQLSNKNKFSKFILDSTLPFKKTPINVAKAGLEYSPVGLVKSAIYDTVQLRKGNITFNTYIDNISKGLTGSGIALVGYALADCGILKATGSDDEDREKFEESRGSQNYSVKIGDNTYSLDWLAPSGIPLFIGAECYELMQAQKEKKTSSSDEDELYNKAINTATNILDSFANAMNPMTEMSMLSGLTSALKSYDQDSSKMLASIGTNAVKSYVNQFVPTALGQVAKTTDQYERSTTSTQKGVLPKAIDTTRTQIMNKIPGLRQMLPIKTDIWGNEIEQSDNVIQRAFENAVFPWARKELNSNSVDKELVKVYKNTGDKAVLPDSINKEITINKQKYTMTSGEYSKYKKQYGENSYKLLNSLVTANGYKKMSDEEKRVAISKIYSYATEQIKVDYAKQNGLEYEQSTLSQVTNAIKKVNGNTSNYFEFIAKTQELDKDIEKIKTLANSNYDENTKKAIYENSLGKRDNKFNIMKETFTTNGLNTTKYLKYKSQEFESDKTDDGTLNGKTVNGSKKKKVWNYIEQMDITYTQKLLLYGLEYTPSNREQTQIVNYINSLPKTQQEKLEMLSKFQGFTIYKDGTFKY